MVYWRDSGEGWQDPTVVGTGPPGSYDHLGVFSGATIEDGYMGFPTAQVKAMPDDFTLRTTKQGHFSTGDILINKVSLELIIV